MAVRLARIGLTSADPVRLAEFYESALGFRRLHPSSPAARHDGGGAVVPAHTVMLRLGDQIVDITAFDPPGAPYPGDVPGWSPLFQHFAIVVSDMAAAYARLSAQPGWRPISTQGPQRLPDSSGGVTAFKFRDPEGHPLEFLAFPEGEAPAFWKRPDAADVCLGIDHSAVSVADTERSVRFYERFGCTVSARSHNVGPEQARLDGLDDSDVAVTGLSLPGQAAPHIELLCYRGAFDRSVTLSAADDVAGTRLVLAFDSHDAFAAACAEHRENLVSSQTTDDTNGRAEALLRDPDGHLLLLTTDA